MIRRPTPIGGNLLQQRPAMVPCGHGAEALRKDAGVIRLAKARRNSDTPFAAKRRRDLDDDDSLPVIVPRSDKVLVPMSATRIRRLREHLRVALHTMKDPKCSASPLRPEPEGFAARVARTACSLCRGWCCRNGDDDASSMTGRWRACGSPGRIWMHARCCGCISIASRSGVQGFVYISWKARLHIGPIFARRCLQ